MPEPRIAIKVVANRFVTVHPMVEPAPDEVTFPQNPMSSRRARESRHRRTPWDGDHTMLNYALTKEDNS